MGFPPRITAVWWPKIKLKRPAIKVIHRKPNYKKMWDLFLERNHICTQPLCGQMEIA